MNQELLNSFSSISLAELQARNELMERKESKYLLHVQQLHRILDNLQEHYDVLDIKGNRIFTYENIYFDTPEYFFYHQHLHQRKNRTKIRTRKYVDSNLDFIEYKQKTNKFIRKERVSIGEEQFGNISQENIEFLEKCFHKYYTDKHDQNFSLIPILRNKYQRITLCHKKQKERVTIDMNISYYDVDSKSQSPNFSLPHLAIIECKYDKSAPFFNELMKKTFTPEVKLCSKYCLGAYYLGKTSSYKTFLPTIMYIEALSKSGALSRNFLQDYQQRISDNKRVKNQYETLGTLAV